MLNYFVSSIGNALLMQFLGEYINMNKVSDSYTRLKIVYFLENYLINTE